MPLVISYGESMASRAARREVLQPTQDQQQWEADLALGSNDNLQRSLWNDQNASRQILLGSDESLE